MLTIDLDDIKQMLELMDQHGLEEFEFEHEGRRVRLRKSSPGQYAGLVADESEPASLASRPAAGAPVPVADEGLVVVKSPIVGTFFSAPEPGKEPFVEVGSLVQKGQSLCIIEAMKLMNEIDAEGSGEVVSIFVENGQPVQYGEKLFAIKPA